MRDVIPGMENQVKKYNEMDAQFMKVFTRICRDV